jgi:hypothetical protein
LRRCRAGRKTSAIICSDSPSSRPWQARQATVFGAGSRSSTTLGSSWVCYRASPAAMSDAAPMRSSCRGVGESTGGAGSSSRYCVAHPTLRRGSAAPASRRVVAALRQDEEPVVAHVPAMPT